MATRTTETGTLAAEAIAELYQEVSGGEPGKGDELWRALAASDWPSASHLEAGEDTLNLREIQEIARASGRFISVTPIASTLLAASWHRDQEIDEGAAILIAIDRAGEQIALDAVPGSHIAVAGDLQPTPEPARVENFVPSSATFVFAPGAVAAVTQAQLAQWRALAAAIAVGCADEVLARSVAWAGTREQFGQPIARFQAVRHHLANMHMAREQAWTAAIAAGIETDRALPWARMATRLARQAIDTGIQVHGGVGFTQEVGLHHFLTRVLELESSLGVSQ